MDAVPRCRRHGGPTATADIGGGGCRWPHAWRALAQVYRGDSCDELAERLESDPELVRQITHVTDFQVRSSIYLARTLLFGAHLATTTAAQGQSLLHLAVLAGKHVAVCWLLSFGADPTQLDSYGANDISPL